VDKVTATLYATLVCATVGILTLILTAIYGYPQWREATARRRAQRLAVAPVKIKSLFIPLGTASVFLFLASGVFAEAWLYFSLKSQHVRLYWLFAVLLVLAIFAFGALVTNVIRKLFEDGVRARANAANLAERHKAEVERIEKSHEAEIAHKDSFITDASAEVRQLRKQLAEHHEKLASRSLSILNEGVPIAGPASEREDLSPDDPRITIEVECSGARGLAPTTGIRVRNVGRAELQKLHLQNFRVAGKDIRFDTNVPIIPPNTPSELIYPVVDGVGPQRRHDLAGQMMEEWEHQGGLKTDKLVFPAKATYEDYRGILYIAEWSYELNPMIYRNTGKADRSLPFRPDTHGPPLVVSSINIHKFKKG